MQKMVSWQSLQSDLEQCEKCGLCKQRKNTVLGMGDMQADVLFVGEGPGRQEDEQGLPFVGAAGQLLDKMLASIGLDRMNNVYIANVVKCRPPGNRTPTEEEALACLDYLRAQTALIKPKIIVCLGATAIAHLIGRQIRVTQDHGKWTQRKNVWMMPTYHPAALLRDESKKRDSYHDLLAIKQKIEELQLEGEEVHGQATGMGETETGL